MVLCGLIVSTEEEASRGRQEIKDAYASYNLAVHTISTGTGMSLVVHSAEAEILNLSLTLDKGDTKQCSSC